MTNRHTALLLLLSHLRSIRSEFCGRGGAQIRGPAAGRRRFRVTRRVFRDGRRRRGQQKLGVQVIALGKGRFEAVGYFGGLPGDGWNGEKPLRAQGEVKDGEVRFQSERGLAKLSKEGIIACDPDGNEVGRLKKVVRQSPTLGKKPPVGAVVLFDGTADSLKNWEGGRMTDDGLLMEGTASKQKFGDHSIHFEFRLAYQPEDRGQGRSNSGIYLQGRYEVQILDSFGLEGKDNECGGIYSVKAPERKHVLPAVIMADFRHRLQGRKV